MSSGYKPFCPCTALVQEFARRCRVMSQTREVRFTTLEAKSADLFRPQGPDLRESLHNQTRLVPAQLTNYYAQLEPAVNHIGQAFSFHILEFLPTSHVVPPRHREELLGAQVNPSIIGLCRSIQRKVQQQSRLNRPKLEYDSVSGRLLNLPPDRLLLPLTLASQNLGLPKHGDNIEHVVFRVKILGGNYYGVHVRGDNCHYLTIYHESDLSISDLLRVKMAQIQTECTVEKVPFSVNINTGAAIWTRSMISRDMPPPQPRPVNAMSSLSHLSSSLRDDIRNEEKILTGGERWANTGDPLASKKLFGHFGSENPGKYLTGFATKEEEKSVISGRKRRLRTNTMLAECVSGEFLDTCLPSANRVAGPLFSPAIMQKLASEPQEKEEKEKEKHKQLSEEKKYRPEDMTPFTLYPPQSVVFTQSAQAYQDIKALDAQGELPSLSPGTIVQRTEEQHEHYFKWTFSVTLPIRGLITQHGWSLKRHAYLIERIVHPETKWFIINPDNVKVYKEPREDETLLATLRLSLAQIIEQVGPLKEGWIQHAFGFSQWQKNMVPLGQNVLTLT